MQAADIYRTANLLVQSHRAEAASEANSRMVKLMEQGDYEGASVWLQIKRAIIHLEMQDAQTIH